MEDPGFIEKSPPEPFHTPSDETNNDNPLGSLDNNDIMNCENSEAGSSAGPEVPPLVFAGDRGETPNLENESDTVILEGEGGIGNTNQSNNGESILVPDKMADRLETSRDAETISTDVSCPEISVGETDLHRGNSESNICENDRLGGDETSIQYSESDGTDHEETNHTDNNNTNCNGIMDGVASVEGRNEPTKTSDLESEQNVNPQPKSLLQSSSVFNERISSDGGSVEIAEEAEEECSVNDNIGDRISPPLDDGNNSENNIQHSKEVSTSSSLTVETKDTLESLPAVESSVLVSHPNDSQSTLIPTNEEPALNRPSFDSNGDNAKSVLPNGSELTQSNVKTAADVEDDLLSELAAELDEVVPEQKVCDVAVSEDLPSSEMESSTQGDGDSFDVGDDIMKMRRLVGEWKKKYCHAEAKLQSLQATATAKAHQDDVIKEERAKVAEEIKKETEAVRKVHLLRIQELEKEVEQRKKENAAARDRQISHDTAAKKAINKLQHEMIQRVDQVKRMYEDAVKEKENMVIRYAKSEKENLDLKKAKEEVEKKRRDAGQGLEVIASHNKQLKAERTKLIGDLDNKDMEIAKLQKEKEEMQDDVSSVGIKVKWAQNKLKTELESHKETKLKLTKTEQRLQEAKEETEQIRKNCQEMIRTYQESEEIRSNSLDIQLKEKEEELKLHFQEKEDHMELHNTRLKELTALKKAHHDTLAELDSLKVKATCLEDERQHTESLLAQFKGLLNSQKEENRKLTRQMDELKSLKRQLDESKENVEVLEKTIASRKEDEKDLESELGRSREKESELLQFTERMTAKNAALHSDNNLLSAKVDKLSEECRKLTSQLEESNSQNSQLTADLNQEKQYREREAALLSARLSEKTKTLDQVKVQLDDAKDEMKTLKRKNAANLKDLTRQLHLAKKRIESLESDGSGAPVNKDTFSSESRTSSTGSLDTLGNSALNGGTVNISSGSSGGGSVGRQEDSPQSSQDHTVAIAGGNDFPGIDKAMLVDRIVRLQKQMQRKAEKIEFLQEHNSQLIEELQKKSKIIQQYIMREEAGALVPAVSDANKAQMSKQSGIMASVYRSHSVDPNMTLDLSLEINRKLQAVLEDTLLKNITLKENIDTLGQEIARLSEEAQFTSRKRQNNSRIK
ncbi:coiled-coil domain-containing protein 186-like isoform X2 [Lytechinus variegatus]|uniref:coiled-coil domain-containing protein 186-like isoform X2 n=1 Tax=Lytechinus variegatus TaxID=7654 RepID=UPI001BB23D6B|nr:coiled-coil domain-containing protein 186-like isoform X2 [Lytechinus variegatus]